MKEAADTIEIDPDRLSTIRAINIIRRTVTDPADFPPTAQNRQHHRAIAELVERLNPPRRKRAYPRVHKRGNRHTYAIKNTTRHRQQNYDPTITLQPPDAA